MSMFAIITFRNEGPMKNWQTIAAANVHNARTKPLAHAMPDAPRPTHLIGSGDLVADMKAAMLGVGIDPSKPRKNGVLGYEAILSATAAFFEQGTVDEQRERLNLWVAEQVKWALDNYGVLRVVSMVLHVDEKVPHIHVVLLPLESKPDARFADKDQARWNLVGRTISGPGKFDEAQDAYAAAMSQFGLVRGVRKSGRKHEPVPVYIARMRQKESELDGERASVRAEGAVLADDRAALDRDRIAHADLVAEDERRLKAERAEITRLHEAAAQAVRDAAAASARINGHRAKLAPVFRAAAEFERRLATLDGKPLAPATASAMEALMALSREGVALRPPIGETRAPVLDVYSSIQRHAAGLREPRGVGR